MVSVMDARTCWRRFSRENEALNSSWCERQDELERSGEEELSKQERNTSVHFNYFCSVTTLVTVPGRVCTVQTLAPGDSGSPLALKESDGKWHLIAISVATKKDLWKIDVCDSSTTNVNIDFFQAVVPDLSWILEIIHEM